MTEEFTEISQKLDLEQGLRQHAEVFAHQVHNPVFPFVYFISVRFVYMRMCFRLCISFLCVLCTCVCVSVFSVYVCVCASLHPSDTPIGGMP